MVLSKIHREFSQREYSNLTVKIDKYVLPQIHKLCLFTINHNTAPVGVREKFAIPEYLLAEAVNNLKSYRSLESFLLLSTCSRTEIYFKAPSLDNALVDIYCFFAEYLGVEKRVAKEYNMVLKEDKAIEHVFKVACGLDSLVVGENQVFSQVRSAYSTAQKEKTLDSTLELLFQSAINGAKEVHKSTDLSKSCQSVSSAAIDLADKVAGPLFTKKIMILGAGKMAKLALEHVLKTGGSRETAVLNRSPHRIIEFPIRYKIDKAFPFGEVYDKMNDVDIVLVATGAPHFVIIADQFNMVRKDPTKPLFIFDISMPRNVDSEFGKLPNVRLYDIDSLRLLDSYESGLDSKANDIGQARKIIAKWTAVFFKKVLEQEMGSLVKDLKDKAEKLRAEKLSKLLGQKQNFTKDEVDYITKNIVNALTHEQIKKIKEQVYK